MLYTGMFARLFSTRDGIGIWPLACSPSRGLGSWVPDLDSVLTHYRKGGHGLRRSNKTRDQSKSGSGRKHMVVMVVIVVMAVMVFFCVSLSTLQQSWMSGAGCSPVR